ncbi:hypothetical protein AYY19_14815 [Photobacterium aquimaris]|uniref:Phosphatidic acid phosphatase type 2/haloperoxidase domain-containing protein n=2 Tax=Photobacterium aquimaris TaxID=512643 RepID=A0A2T3IR46_9GAMM|nr:hypothetical protein [Photobacterium aquimaris]OBU16917.1 hypothetical protein AYY19_14815 [Photobacterium aquimaris]OBU21751.1 hypothetical protein AYY20_13340 [Photobacterium aquimaris]PSU30812.1 hypothetical protein CTM88_04250 [Photobacterium aquimaris]PSW00104.1 hypothetical protein CTM91_13515 [Photobacterium aquimaris]
MTFEQWAVIADLYTPIIVIVCVICMLLAGRQHGLKDGLLQLGGVVLSAVFIYAIMFIDNVIGIWPAFDLDYSTHTAIGLVFIGYFMVYRPKLSVLMILSMIGYAALMMHQKYHTLADIMTTTICVMPVILLCQYKLAAIAKR